MTKYTVLVTDETVFHKVIDIPDDKDPQEYVESRILWITKKVIQS